MLALEFPSIDNLVKWPAIFGEGEFYSFNKIGLISVIAFVAPTLLFLLSRKELVPSGVQNIVEGVVGFVDKQIIDSIMGPKGRPYLPLLLSIFMFIFIGNIFEVIPVFQMPANARIANPLLMALLVWVVYIGVGLKHNGLEYLKASLFPPGVPWIMYIIVTPIELISTFILRPFSMTIRLFANMLAGHILLVTFGVLTISMWELFEVASILPFSVLVLLTGFEAMVSFLQAFIFTLLAAVYIDSSLDVHH